MFKTHVVVGVIAAILVVLVCPIYQSCGNSSKSYLEITDKDFIVGDIPSNWSIATKDEIAKAQEIEEKNLGDDSNRIKANVLLSAGLNRGDSHSFPHVVIEVIPLGKFKTLNQVIDFNESIYKKIFIGYERIYINYSKDNTMAILMYQYYLSNDTPLVILDGWVVNKSVVWRVGCTSLANEFEEDASVFSDILSSFVIKDGHITFGEVKLNKGN